MATRVAREATTIDAAWRLARGAGCVLAVVDEGIDVSDHSDFAGRTLAGRYGVRQEVQARPAHGVKVAGLALGGGREAPGIAPEALLLPVPVPTLGTVAPQAPPEADAIRWAADHGADVICCAWAPHRPTAESGMLPAQTRAAIDHCLTNGRGGKGCVIVFSVGNDGSDVALNGYASHPGVVAVGACNCHGKHPTYSGWGDTLWCVFPSNDPHDPVGASMTYLTTAPVGSLLHGEAFYTTRFGFTSAACAAVAGICALIVSANPELTSTEVKHVLRGSCDKIDLDGGTYDERGHSPLYGYGRPDVARAVRLARSHAKARTASV